MKTKLKVIGGQGGSSFTFTGRDNGATLKKIGVAVGGWQIKAVRAELTDGRVKTFGESVTFKEFTFEPGERFTKLSLWGNDDGSRLGGIRFLTSSGREFFEQMTSMGLNTEYSIDVGSGVCLGLQGKAGSDIDCLGFLFIKANTSIPQRMFKWLGRLTCLFQRGSSSESAPGDEDRDAPRTAGTLSPVSEATMDDMGAMRPRTTSYARSSDEEQEKEANDMSPPRGQNTKQDEPLAPEAPRANAVTPTEVTESHDGVTSSPSPPTTQGTFKDSTREGEEVERTEKGPEVEQISDHVSGLLNTATTLKVIGGQGGSSFTFTGRDNGATLKKIGVAVGGWQIKAVRAELTDGRVKTFGNSVTFKEFTFELGECITKLSLWGNDDGSRLGGIRFWTSSGREFFEQMTSMGLNTEYSIDVGSGVCLGLQGNAGSDIDCLGFLFINAIKSSVLTDMTYPSLAMYTPQVNKEYIKTLSHQNDTTAAQEHKCAYSRSVTKSTTWSTTTKMEGTVNMSVHAGIPKLVGGSGGFSLTTGAVLLSTMNSSETITESDEVNVTVPARKTVSVDLTVGRADINLPYSATVKITCMNGSELVFPSTGNYSGVAYTAVHLKTTESDYVMNVE
ncbi:aerolysin-like protein [Gadus macrocephalus]|uniref:aerolysin-like protein n=1 Tax=Gadus macrocephalus TaxID=80720 RepID=UPI0028CB3665|nr:aerolysin-like protein [Gadus macrocephalus]XP_059915545.1 aerolysin-like protein [Gadus macrocephalus]XP_059915546.1 aerolysin-like protein [Gadus macrocephalus]